MKVAGFWISDKKGKKLDFDSFSDTYKSDDLCFKKLDLSKPLEDQGPFDIIIHKLIELLVTADMGCPVSQEQVKVFQSYLTTHNRIICLDPLERMGPMLNRGQQYTLIKNSMLNNGLDDTVFMPKFCTIDLNDMSKAVDCLKCAGVTFPAVCKPELAHGADAAHEMSIVFNEAGLHDLRGECVAQSFVDHNAKLYKIFVVGCAIYVCDRPSIKNLKSGSYPTLFFHSHDISKEDSDSHLSQMDDSEATIHPPEVDLGLFNQIAVACRHEFGLDLIGIDVIRCNKTGKYAIIDVNIFPGYEKMPNFFHHLVQLIRQKLDLPLDSSHTLPNCLPSA